MLKIEIKTGNAAYRNEDETLDTKELIRNLDDISRKLKAGYLEGSVMDINGNKSGTWKLED